MVLKLMTSKEVIDKWIEIQPGLYVRKNAVEEYHRIQIRRESSKNYINHLRLMLGINDVRCH